MPGSKLFSRKLGAERYGLPMVLLLLSMAVIMGTGVSAEADAAALTLLGLALLATFRAAETRLMLRLPVSVLILVAILVAWYQAIFFEQVDHSVVPIMVVALVVIATPVIVIGLFRQAERDGGMSVHTMFGAICIYLLISLGFASIFAVIAVKSTTPFFTQGPHWDSLRECLYYSLTTITTVGIGDLTPATDLGRSLTATEALIGQIYIVTVVALVVSQVARRPRERK